MLYPRKKFRKIYIEISNVCNLKCSFCPQTDLQRQSDFMTVDFFHSLVKQVSPKVYLLCLHVMGEPLNHPQLNEMIDVCEKENQAVSIVSNGVQLSDVNIKALLNPTVHQVNFSLQSFGDNFPQASNKNYLKRVFHFVQLATELRPDMHINLRLWNAGHDQKTIAQNREILAEIASFLKLDLDELAKLSLKGHRITGNIFLNLAERFEWPEVDGPIVAERGFCPALKHQFAILVDGTVIPCCFDREGVIKLGSCKEMSLDEVLSGPRSQAMREGFMQNKLVEDLCKRCTYRLRFNS
ncbi:radical SAM protein [Lentisphaera profundi]|uniref:Radical SAM protein n=1 Tax=Lentisphaera profundi TaxID=1658616 RepID=A0ABY7VW85_9BACT|nr:radical SAM/SPASM domain-containing protein [Lentisphaera profundi]WDE96999.1 radical SAM protein [Lentisphaera profundi]